MPPSIGRSGAGACTFGSSRDRQAPIFAGAGSVRPAGQLDPEVGGDIVQHLGTVVTDQMLRAAAVRPGPVRDIDHSLDPWQFRRQRAAVAFGWPGSWRLLCRPLGQGRRRLHRGALLRHRLLGIRDTLLRCRIVELFGPSAEAVQRQFVAEVLGPAMRAGNDGVPLYFADGTHPSYTTHAAYGWIRRGETRELKSNHGRPTAASTVR